MKFCINCGSKLNDDDLFCMECGYKCNDVKEKNEAIEKEETSLPEEDVIVAPPIVSNSKEDRLRALEEERKSLEAEIEEEKRQAELERQRQEELERQRQEELERQIQEELERQRQEELERQREAELERQRQEELERERQEEQERQRQAELEKEKPEEVLVAAPIEEKALEEKSTETPSEEKKEPLEEKKEEPLKEKDSKLSDEENLPIIKHSLFFTGLILILSIIYWFIGAFLYIHVAIRIAFIFICMGAMALPIYETVKYVIASIKAKKFNLFTLITLGICQVLLFILFFISISVAAS